MKGCNVYLGCGLTKLPEVLDVDVEVPEVRMDWFPWKTGVDTQTHTHTHTLGKPSCCKQHLALGQFNGSSMKL